MCKHINIGTGVDLTIKQLAETIKGVVGYAGSLAFDHNKPDSSPRKLMDSQRLNSLDWTPKTNLEDGLQQAYTAFRAMLDS